MDFELAIKSALWLTGICILVTIFLLFIFFVIVHFFFKGDIVKMNDFHLVKRKLEEGVVYYTLHIRKNKWPWAKFKPIGEYFSNNKFIVYKFNSVEEAELFYDNL